MKTLSSKKRLTSFDIPGDIPANIFNLDLTHAADSYQGGGILCLEDIPRSLPVINKKTGKISMFAGGRRAVSMPIFSRNNKELPQLPPIEQIEVENEKANKRSISMYPLVTSVKNLDEDNISDSEDELPVSAAKNIIVDEDDDSLFSSYTCHDSTSASSAPSGSDFYEGSSKYSTKSILRTFEEDFVNESIFSEEDIIVEEIGLPVIDLDKTCDITSLGDSLWDSDKDGTIYQDATDETADLVLPNFYYSPKTIETEKELPSISHLASDPKLNIPKTRRKAQRPVSMLSLSNQSMFSLNSVAKSLNDCKKEMKAQIKLINVCLDSGADYIYSKYPRDIKVKPRAVSSNILQSHLYANEAESPKTNERRWSSAQMGTTGVSSEIHSKDLRRLRVTFPDQLPSSLVIESPEANIFNPNERSSSSTSRVVLKKRLPKLPI